MSTCWLIDAAYALKGHPDKIDYTRLLVKRHREASIDKLVVKHGESNKAPDEAEEPQVVRVDPGIRVDGKCVRVCHRVLEQAVPGRGIICDSRWCVCVCVCCVCVCVCVLSTAIPTMMIVYDDDDDDDDNNDYDSDDGDDNNDYDSDDGDDDDDDGDNNDYDSDDGDDK